MPPRCESDCPTPGRWKQSMTPEKRPKRSKIQVGNDMPPFEANEIQQVVVVKSWLQLAGEFTMMAVAALVAAAVAYYVFPIIPTLF